MRRYHHAALPAPGERLTLPRDTSHHILQVCRHPRGEPLTLFDGAGSEATCTLVDVKGGQAVVACTALLPPCAPTHRVTLLLALCKPAAWETSMRMATELGVDHIQPVLCSRSTVRKLRLERWQRVLVAACEQSGRRWLPTLAAPLPLVRALCEPSLPSRRLQMAPGAPSPAPEPHRGDLALLVGPEGGLSAQEQAEAAQAGFEPAGLGTHVLRVDTAVAAALARYGVSCS
jgi:16S rRNA (uracil1498-N3)-methyltransferase